MKICDGCGKQLRGGYSLGGAMLCRDCEPEVNAQIEKLRNAGKPVNALHVARKMYKEMHSSGNYMLRDVPKDLMDQVKHVSIDEGCSVREIVIKAMYAYIK